MEAGRATTYRVEIEDKPGSLQKLLAKLAKAGVDLQCFAAYSAGRGKGQVYLCSKDEEGLATALRKARTKATTAACFCISDEDKPGAAAEALKQLAKAKVNGLAGAAMVCGGKYHLMLIVDEKDSNKAAEVFCVC